MRRCSCSLIVAAILVLAQLTPEIAGQTHAPSHLAACRNLRTAAQVEPLAVASDKPDLSWKLTPASTALHGTRQTSYAIRIFSAPSSAGKLGHALWDSGKVAGSSTSAPADAYAGPALQPDMEYAWQVRVWDEYGQASPWSRLAHWHQAPQWHAKWIASAASDAAAGNKPMPLFRKNLPIDSAVKLAILHVSGLGQYEFRINGAKVGQSELAPGWSNYRKTVYYDSYDVTSMLHNGDNALGILLGNGMYRVPKTPGRYIKFDGTFGPPKCIAQLRIELTNGKSLTVTSDETWKTHSGPITFSNTYGGEDYDARREPTGWDQPNFNDSDWPAALVTDGPAGMLRPELAPPIRVMHTYAPIHRSEPRPGVLVYDLGQNFAGWPAIAVSGPAGAYVKLIPGELLNADGTVSQHSSGEPQWFAYILRGSGVEHWQPRFSYYGFRYVQVEGVATPHSGATTSAQLISLRGEAVHTSSPTVGSFSSSDALLNRIHTLIVRAIENNAESLFTDCPHREKLGWLEETHLLASAMLYDFDFAGIYAATARNIADTQDQDGPHLGRLPEIAPQYVLFQPQWGEFDDSPEWGSAAVLAPWYVYQRDGNRDALLSHLDVMRRYVDYLGTRADHNIIAYGLGDWFDIGPGEPGVSKLTTLGLTATATYYQDLRVLQKCLALAGRNDESKTYSDKADAVRQSFNARFFNPAQRHYDKGSQTAQAMPLVVGLVPENQTNTDQRNPDQRSAVLDSLVADIRAHNNHVTAGDIGFHYVVDALLDGGRSDVLYDMLLRTDSPSYGYQLSKGATALTEAWDADPDSSQDHFMLGHAEEWFYRGLGGIQIDFSAEPQSQLLIRPEIVGKLSSVRTSYDSVWGPIESNWKRGPQSTEYDILIPPNATATVELKTAKPQAVQVNGAPVRMEGAVVQVNGAKALQVAKAAHPSGVIKAVPGEHMIDLVLGSGRYRILARNDSAHP